MLILVYLCHRCFYIQGIQCLLLLMLGTGCYWECFFKATNFCWSWKVLPTTLHTCITPPQLTWAWLGRGQNPKIGLLELISLSSTRCIFSFLFFCLQFDSLNRVVMLPLQSGSATFGNCSNQADVSPSGCWLARCCGKDKENSSGGWRLHRLCRQQDVVPICTSCYFARGVWCISESDW